MSLEVKTMPFEKSSSKAVGLHPWFHPTLLRKNLTRFWPIWALYGVIWGFLMPVVLLTSYQYPSSMSVMGAFELSGAQYFSRCHVLQILSASVPLGLVFGIVAAMAVFSYLYQGRSVGLLHALPIRREGLFLTNYLSGLCFFALPLGVVFLLTLGAELLAGAVYLPALFCWLFVNLLIALFFYSFAVFCAMFTGHILALPAFYAILNGLAAGLCYLTEQVLDHFVYGFNGVQGMGVAAEWLTPTIKLMGSLYVDAVETGGGQGAVYLKGLLPVFLYAAVGLALAVLALVVYRRRQLECAGDVVSVRWVRPVFKYGVAFCTAISLGLLLYQIFEYSVPEGPWTLLVFLILAGGVGYFAAEMLLHKSFRVFSRGWKGMAVFSLALAAAVCCMVFDVTGFERRVPDPARVASVSFNGVNTYPDDDARWNGVTLRDPEEIELVTRLHTALVAERADRRTGGYASESRTVGGVSLDVQTGTQTELTLDYTLSDGSVVSRSYSVPISEERLSDPGSAASLLSGLVNRPDVVERSYFGFLNNYEQTRLTDVMVTVPQGSYEEGYSTDQLPLDLDAGARSELLEAIKTDMAAGNLGRRYLLENEERFTNCYFNDLQLTFYVSGDRLDEGRYDTSPGVTITLQAGAVNTLRVLKEHGLDPALLVTVADWYGGNPGNFSGRPDTEVPADTVYAAVTG